MNDPLGARMKGYEFVTTSTALIRRLPVIIRVDGRAFHTWTRGLARPFDTRLTNAMTGAASELLGSIQNCKLVYTQSDEANFLLLDTDRLETQPWLGYDLQKVVSLSAAEMTAEFNEVARQTGLLSTSPRRPATFDSRAFNLPPAEVANYFLWRVRDAHRNAILAIAQSRLSARAMHGKKCAELLEIPGVRSLYDECSRQARLGTWIIPTLGHIANNHRRETAEPNYEDVSWLVDEAIGTADRRIVDP